MQCALKHVLQKQAHSCDYDGSLSDGRLTARRARTIIVLRYWAMHRRQIILSTCLLFTPIFANSQTSAGLDPSALFDKGMNALTGSSATRSGANAIEYFRRSADLGFGPAQVVLGYFYETGLNTTADPGEAFELYKKAAQQGDPLAQWLAGRMIYQIGRAHV